jgi:hypothetical protein
MALLALLLMLNTIFGVDIALGGDEYHWPP